MDEARDETPEILTSYLSREDKSNIFEDYE